MGAEVGKNFKVFGWLKLHIRPGSRIRIGDNVTINSCFLKNPVGGSLRTGIWVEKRGQLVIEDGAGISNSTIVCTNAVRIGTNSFVGGDCKIYDTDFHPIDFTERINNVEAKSKAVDIGKGVFIGGHCIILKGAKIGDEAVIGAGAVVTGEIPSAEIWAGNPAKFIRGIS
jgi:acetyltransferase-like isoleucine patch superfamily enzyme